MCDLYISIMVIWQCRTGRKCSLHELLKTSCLKHFVTNEVFEPFVRRFSDEIYSFDKSGNLPIQLLLENSSYARQDDNKARQSLFAPQVRTPNHLTPNEKGTALKILLNHSLGKTSSQRGPKHFYPLHLALSSGLTWDSGIRELVQYSPEVLTAKNPDNNLYPFMQSASYKYHSDLTTIFLLLKEKPDLCHITIDKSLKTYRRIKTKDTDMALSVGVKRKTVPSTELMLGRRPLVESNELPVLNRVKKARKNIGGTGKSLRKPRRRINYNLHSHSILESVEVIV